MQMNDFYRKDKLTKQKIQAYRRGVGAAIIIVPRKWPRRFKNMWLD